MTGIAYLVAAGIAGFLAWMFGKKNTQQQEINRAKVPDAVLQWEPQVFAAAREFNVPVTILWAMLWQESGGNALARGSAGEIGLMQLKEIAVKDVRLRGYGKFENWKRDPETNIRAGAAFLHLQQERTGSWLKAVKAYNQGYQGAQERPELANQYLEAVRQKEKFFR